jgi:hypothetical protein
MNNYKRIHLLFLLLSLSVFSKLNGQIIDSKDYLSMSAGTVFFGGQDNLLFPKGLNNGSLSFKIDYLKTVLPYMKAGIEGSLILPGVQGKGSSDFATIAINNEGILTAGLNATFFLPYRETGWRNRLRLQFGVAPVAVVHSGVRVVTIDNSVWNIGNQAYDSSSLTVKESTGFGLSLTPTVEYYIGQSIGLKLSYNSLLTSMKSDLNTENIMINSLNFGLFFTFGTDKHFNY